MKKILLLLITTTFLVAQNLPINSVVKVYASLSVPDYKQPWQSPNRTQVSGSGVVSLPLIRTA